MAPLLAVTCGIVLLAAAAQAVTGFGFALIAVPLITTVTDPRTAVVAATIAGIALTVSVAVRERRYARWSAVGWLVASSLLGMPLGLLLLRLAPAALLTVLIGIGVTGCALLLWRGLRLPDRRPVVLAVGLCAGTLSTSTGTNGPPLVAAFQAMGLPRRTFRATLSAIFAVNGVASVVGFAATGQATPTTWTIGLLGVPAVVLGWWLGNHIFHRVDEALFRRILLGALFAGGILILVHGMSDISG